MHKVYISLVYIFLFLFNEAFSTTYYVNDNITTGDIYCTAVGASGNSGTSANSPKELLSQIISTYVLTANDLIYIDKGTYTDAITFTSSDQGSSSGYLQIIGAGSTNTIINCNTGANTVYFNDADYISLDGLQLNMTTSGSSQTTLYIYKSSDNNIIKNCTITSTSTAGFSTPDLHFAVSIASSSSTLIPDNNLLLNNTIDAARYGIFLKGNSATNSEMADGNIISGNTISMSNIPTSGTIPCTYVHFTKNTEIRRNKFQNFYTGLYLGATGSGSSDQNVSLKIYNNYFSSVDTESDIFCGIHIKNANTSSADIKIYNNTFYFQNGAYGCIHFENQNSGIGVKIYNNLFQIPPTAIPSIGSSAILTFDNATPGKLDSIDFNYYNPGGYDVYCRGTTCYATLADLITYDHDNRTGKNGDANSIDDNTIANPLLTNPNTHNLDLQAGSSMLAKAHAVWGIDRDINSYSRPTAGSTPIAIGADDNGSTPLPIEYITFNSVYVGSNAVRLNWTTSSELNNKEFTIERSYNGTEFSEIGNVTGAGTSHIVNSYEYYDTEIVSTDNIYYRIKQVDFDYNFTYSPIICLCNYKNKIFSANLYSNPILNDQSIKININSEEKNRCTLQLLNLEGNLIYKDEFTTTKGISLKTISNSQLKLNSGIYLINLSTENNDYLSFRLVVN